MAAQPSCHEQIFVAISAMEFGWKQKKIHYILITIEKTRVKWAPGEDEWTSALVKSA